MKCFRPWTVVLAACGLGFFAPAVKSEAGSDYAITIRVQDTSLSEAELKQRVESAVREALRERKGDVQSVDIEQVSVPEREGKEKIYGKLFDPLIADPRWPHFSASYQRYRRVSQDIGSANFGGWFATPTANAPFEGNWQLGIQGGVFSIFDLGAASKDLVNADYFVALPTFSYRKDDFSLLARLFHQSSHLGDEFILFNEITPQERVNLSYEAVDLLLSYDLDFLGEDIWRIYGGGAYLFHIDPEDVDPWWIQYGLEFDSQWVFPEKPLLGMKLKPVAGANFGHRQERDWSTDVSLRAGFEIEEFFSRPLDHQLQVLLEYYRGSSPNGQFFDEDIEYLGFGLHAFFF